MRIYVVGPITGHDDLNLTAFEDARDKLEKAGYRVLLPHDFVAADALWHKAMRRSLETLVKADGIACLDGWSNSHGATHEVETALWLGMPVMGVGDWIDPVRSARAIDEVGRMKDCPKCKRIVPLSLFNRSANAFDGKQAYCRDCMADRGRGD
jgi:hypothetical protein